MLGYCRSWLVGALVAGALLGRPELAAAQDTGAADPPAGEAPPDASHDAEARGLFEAGRAAFADGRFEDALRYFEQSHALSHRPELLYNIGSAADRLQREEQALHAFEEYVERLPDAPNRREVEGRIRVLREHMQRVQAERDAAAAAAAAQAADDAATAPVTDPLATEDSGSGGGVEGEWWFWTLLVVGAAGIAAVVTAIVLTQTDTTYPPYITGDEGSIAFTLTMPQVVW